MADRVRATQQAETTTPTEDAKPKTAGERLDSIIADHKGTAKRKKLVQKKLDKYNKEMKELNVKTEELAKLLTPPA